MGIRYIERQTKANVLFLKRLAGTSSGPKAFVKKWVSHLKEQCSGGTYFGCPLANMGAQTTWDDEQFKPVLDKSFKELHQVLTGYFKDLITKGTIPKQDPKRIANAALTLYEGAVTLYRSTGNLEYIDSLQQSFAMIFTVHKSN